MNVRFFDYEFYDPLQDRTSLRMQAITNIGTWWADIDANSRGITRQRKAFKDAALESISLGEAPSHVDLNGL